MTIWLAQLTRLLAARSDSVVAQYLMSHTQARTQSGHAKRARNGQRASSRFLPRCSRGAHLICHMSVVHRACPPTGCFSTTHTQQHFTHQPTQRPRRFGIATINTKNNNNNSNNKDDDNYNNNADINNNNNNNNNDDDDNDNNNNKTTTTTTSTTTPITATVTTITTTTTATTTTKQQRFTTTTITEKKTYTTAATTATTTTTTSVTNKP